MKIKSKHLAIGAAVFTLGIGLFSCILIGSCFLLPFVATNRDPEITVSGRAEFAGLDGDEALFDMLEMMGDDPADPDKLREADNKVTEVISICTDSGNTYLCHFRPGEHPSFAHNLRKGMRVTISGTHESSLGNVHTLSNCRVIGVVR